MVAVRPTTAGRVVAPNPTGDAAEPPAATATAGGEELPSHGDVPIGKLIKGEEVLGG